jgi:hypothetical protein
MYRYLLDAGVRARLDGAPLHEYVTGARLP